MWVQRGGRFESTWGGERTLALDGAAEAPVDRMPRRAARAVTAVLATIPGAARAALPLTL